MQTSPWRTHFMHGSLWVSFFAPFPSQLHGRAHHWVTLSLCPQIPAGSPILGESKKWIFSVLQSFPTGWCKPSQLLGAAWRRGECWCPSCFLLAWWLGCLPLHHTVQFPNLHKPKWLSSRLWIPVFTLRKALQPSPCWDLAPVLARAYDSVDETCLDQTMG